jgi:1-acyl-sn-glycerol-3-phosphate acyltransferase
MKPKFTYRLTQWTLQFLGFVLWRVHAEGRDRIPRDGALIVAPTHESYLDPLLIGAYLPRDLAFMARRTLFVKVDETGERRRKLFSAWGRWAGVIELDREGADRAALKAALGALGDGRAVLVFPEGTRSSDGNVQEFRAGVALMALRSGAPVVPISIDGTRRIWGKGMKRPRFGPGPVRIVFGEPVKYERPAKAEDVAADLRRRVLDLRGEWHKDGACDGAQSRGDAGGGSST